MNNVSLESQILLLAFVTGLIFYYSRILSQIIGKLKCQEKRLNWHVTVARLLTLCIGILCLNSVILSIRIPLDLFRNRTSLLLDLLIFIAIFFAFIILTIVFYYSFRNPETKKIINQLQGDNIEQNDSSEKNQK